MAGLFADCGTVENVKLCRGAYYLLSLRDKLNFPSSTVLGCRIVSKNPSRCLCLDYLANKCKRKGGWTTRSRLF